ncbi:MAG: thiopeptide-type bacteriocin biosynthesis protein [Acidobacteriota bacterium]
MPWTSVHIHLESVGAAADTFLIDHLRPELDRELAAGGLRRWFFLRYSEGGPHLRLRFLPTPRRASRGRVPTGSTARRRAIVHGAAFADRLAARVATAGGSLHCERYDRAAHSFGDTPESVYAELLNEATSRLGLGLVQAFGPERRGERWIALTCALGRVQQQASATSSELAAELAASCDFAFRAARTLGLDAGSDGAEDERSRRARAVRAAWPHVIASLPGALTEPLVALLRRVRRRGPAGREVATHALHLLCNKAGYSLAEERASFSALQDLPPRLVYPSTTRDRSRS